MLNLKSYISKCKSESTYIYTNISHQTCVIAYTILYKISVKLLSKVSEVNKNMKIMVKEKPAPFALLILLLYLDTFNKIS